MPIELPNLDDRNYDDLVQEALSLIHTYAPDWTNYNPSDPGIALIEMFAYLTEMQIYRLNRVTDANVRMFLKLLNGEWTKKETLPTENLQEKVRETILQLRSPYRAVTCQDYEHLSTENFNNYLAQMGKLQDVGRIQRAYCVAERNLETNVEEERKQTALGHVSVIILPERDEFDPKEPKVQPNEQQRQELWTYLDDRRLLTTRHHVVGPTYLPISAQIQVVRRYDALDEKLRQKIIKAIAVFLSPLPVPETSNLAGWQFGRNVYISELYKLLEQIQGVDYIPDIQLTSTAQPILNDQGEKIGLQLYDHHLPAFNVKNTVIDVRGESDGN